MDTSKIELFRKAFLKLDRAMGNHTRSDWTCFGVSLPQCHTLVEIGLAGKISIKELSSILKLDKSTLSRTVDALVTAELVDRIPNPNDRRFIQVMLSGEGTKIFERINSIWYQFCNELLEKIPPKKHKQILESMIILIEALSGDDLADRYINTCRSDKEQKRV